MVPFKVAEIQLVELFYLCHRDNSRVCFYREDRSKHCFTCLYFLIDYAISQLNLSFYAGSITATIAYAIFALEFICFVHTRFRVFHEREFSKVTIIVNAFALQTVVHVSGDRFLLLLRKLIAYDESTGIQRIVDDEQSNVIPCS